MIEKIVQQHVVLGNGSASKVQSNDIVFIRPKHVMTHDNTAAVMSKYASLVPSRSNTNTGSSSETSSRSAAAFASAEQVVFTLDHNVQDKSEKNALKYKEIEAFARQQGCDFYPAGRGIGHQVMVEEGYVRPFTLIVASDSHSNMYGGLGALGTPVVRTDAAAIWATGRTWWQIPPVSRVKLTGKLQEGVEGKDVIITLCGLFNKDEVLNHAIEFTGDGIASLSIDERLTISNMTTEWGSLAGVFPVDDVTISWLENQANSSSSSTTSTTTTASNRSKRLNPSVISNIKRDVDLGVYKADEGAKYVVDIELDLSTVNPHVSGPNEVKIMTSVDEIEAKRVKIHKAYIVSCVNSRVSDLAKAAAILRGKKIASHVELYIAAASSDVESESKKRSDWQALLQAGARPLPPGCGPCVGLGAGLLQDGEIGISATNRNFKGRMGSKNALAYLASPAVVAASALNGYISAPPTSAKFNALNKDKKLIYKISQSSSSSSSSSSSATSATSATTTNVSIIEGFPKVIKGDLIWCHKDNLNTDGIYAGVHTYTEGMTKEQMANVAMENYDPNFVKITKAGNVLVGGFNFGTGSSREQAATALKFRGFQAVIAGSFSETYKRNALNNGLLVIEIPDLVNHLHQQYGTSQATICTNQPLELDFTQCQARFGKQTFTFSQFGPAAQELIVKDGLENWVRSQVS